MAGAEYGQRLGRTRARMAAAQVDGLLVASQYNRRYLTGFTAHDGDITESSGWVLVTEQTLGLVTGTFSLSGLEHEIEASGAQVLLTDRSAPAAVALAAAREAGVRRLGFEREWFSYARYEQIARAAAELAQGEIELVPVEDLVEFVRAQKDAAELATMRRAAAIANEAFARLMPRIAVGMSERQIAALLEDLMVELGASGPSFPTIVACGPGGAQPHAVPGDRPVVAGEPLLLDFGCRVDGYCSDLTRTICIGEPSQRLVEIYGVVRAAQDAVMAALDAGTRTGRAVDAAARQVITDAGYGDAFIHSLGHGVGLAVHELPRAPWQRTHTPEAEAELARVDHLEAGDVLTNEPGIYLPGWGGVRLEDMLLIEEHGASLFTDRNPEQILRVG